MYSVEEVELVAPYQSIRERQVLCEAEGCLDLVNVLADRWPPRPEVRDRLANRALDLLATVAPSADARADWFYLIGHAYRTMERYRDALEPLKKSAELAVDTVHAWLALGWCYKRCGRLDLAIESLEAGLLHDDRQAILHYNLACYWSLVENHKLSVAYLTRALELDSEYRKLVADEPDFDAVREDPAFQSLLTVVV